jgi:hypothetical protein
MGTDETQIEEREVGEGTFATFVWNKSSLISVKEISWITFYIRRNLGFMKPDRLQKLRPNAS